MIISYIYPYDLTQTQLFADTEKDFEKIPVNSAGYIESNKFLVSLWNQVNTHICPKHCVDRAPWAYFPQKIIGKKTSVSVLGFCQTSIGELFFALEYHKKGDIDSLLVMRPTSKFKREEIRSLTFLVNDAKIYVDKTTRFLCKAKVSTSLKNVCFAEYNASNFSIKPCDGSSEILFYVNAIDRFEAEQQALERLYEICAFLTVETNIYCSFEEFYVRANEILPERKTLSPFIDDYIDYYPISDNWEICISSYAYNFISNNILSIGRFEKRSETEKYFISSCKHIQIGIETEIRIGTVPLASMPSWTFELLKKEQLNTGEYVTSALMSYLSAIECATVTEAHYKTCKECGAVIYKIANRVRNLSTEFLCDDLGKVFHKLYTYRSKFLHTGRMASDANVVRTIPLLSEFSETGVKEFGNLAVKLEGKIYSFKISNIREWSTYILRCYYQKRILGRVSFANVSDKRREITLADLPIKITAVCPEGCEQIKNTFVKTDTLKYKIRIFFSRLMHIMKRFCVKCNCS